VLLLSLGRGGGGGGSNSSKDEAGDTVDCGNGGMGVKALPGGLGLVSQNLSSPHFSEVS